MVEAKTTREISEDYNHKAPDSLLNGNEVWFRKDEVVKRLYNVAVKLKVPYSDVLEIFDCSLTSRIEDKPFCYCKMVKVDECKKCFFNSYCSLAPDVKCVEFNEVFISGASTKSAKHHAKTSEFLARNKELNTRRSRNSGVMCKSLVGVAEADSPHTELSVSKGMKSVVPEFASVKRGNKSRGVCRLQKPKKVKK